MQPLCYYATQEVSKAVFRGKPRDDMKRKMVDLGDQFPGGHRLPRWLLDLGERFLGFHALNTAHAHIDDDWENGSEENFFHLACKYLSLNYDLEGLDNIPKEGPCVIVSNHPHGLSDGLMFGDVAMKVRSDIRIVVNEFLTCVHGMRPYTITVDVYGGDAAKRANMAGMREILKWLREGHCVLVFPSGSAASWSPRDGRIVDDPWQANITAIIRKTGATVVPMHISGHTGRLFQMVTRLSKEHRAPLLPREIKRDGRMRHQIRLGKPIPATSFEILPDDQALSDYFRLCSMLLRYPRDKEVVEQAEAAHRYPVDAPVPAELLDAEVSALPPDCLVYESESSGLQVYAAEAEQIPQMLQEIGVQRELTFRAVGEGTGTACDLDRYDQHYIHLFIWDTRERKLVGAYRIGRTDRIMSEFGVTGIYNSNFFKFKDSAIPVLVQGLEMGRAFIVPEYQRLATSLDTLWMGIGRYLCRHPEYRYLYGTVSISSEYNSLSRSLILSYLQQNVMNNELAEGVKAYFPPTELGLLSEDARLLPTALEDARLLGSLVSELEEDGKSIPVLLRQYLRLGGRMLSFGIDKDFGSTLDCFVLIDLREAPERVLRRYCGKEYVDSLRA